jgi:Fe-S oxidoreductase
MLTTPEKILFTIALLASASAGLIAVRRIIAVIGSGQGQVDWSIVPGRLLSALGKSAALTPVFRTRFLASVFHALVAWGFLFYLLVNFGDILEAYIPGFTFAGHGTIGEIYRMLSDIFSVATLLGVIALMIRRFVLKSPALHTRESTLLHPKAAAGKQRDSLIVGLFILTHTGFRLLGESFQIAAHGPDPIQPVANLLAKAWGGWSENAVIVGEHVGFWVALGVILAFIPYFLYSKHIHLFFAPINFLLTPEYNSPGELDALDFEDESIEQFGVTRLEDLNWFQIMDAYACIMCNRCQDVCPAYTTGKVLSPAALEINKRYFINQEVKALAAGEESSQTMLEFAITEEAVMACTACGACTNICPVGNDPMRDILGTRRALVLMDNKFPEQWQAAFRGMERTYNPWGVPPAERMKWAEGLDVPTIEKNPEPDILWWVGCAPATDNNAQKSAQAFANLLAAAGVNYAVLGQNEMCTGDSARRAGNEYLFYELALGNIEILNEVAPKRIVTTCPHCLHAIKNEYKAFGGDFNVIHHTELIEELIDQGKLEVEGGDGAITFHDPCYLGRQNGVLDEPRRVLKSTGANLVEMKLSGEKSFCCGAGGAQMWKEEEHGEIAVSEQRFKQAAATNADMVAVGCPFCMVMFNDAAAAEGSDIQIKDVAEIIVDKLK